MRRPYGGMRPKPLPRDRNTTILLCSIVNRYSQGQGFYCMPANLEFVRPGFLYRCVQAAVSGSDLTDEGKALATAWMKQRT